MTDVVATDEELELAEELAWIRHQRSTLTSRETEVREQLLEVLQGEGKLLHPTAGDELVTVTTQHRRSVNRKKLEAMHPSVFEDVIEESESKVLTLGARYKE